MEAMIEVVSSGLQFPDWCGLNWNALYDCICDLSWLPDGDVVIVHTALPFGSQPPLLVSYISVLHAAVERAAREGKRRLIVSFPSNSRLLIEQLELK
jgi:hypothetical protein